MVERPSNGVRVALTRAAVEPAEVRYRVELAFPDRSCETVATIALGAGVLEQRAISFAAWSGGDVDDATIEVVAGFLRTMLARVRRDPATPWPESLHRWREPHAR